MLENFEDRYKPVNVNDIVFADDESKQLIVVVKNRKFKIFTTELNRNFHK